MKNKNSIPWLICISVAFILVIITFTPLVTPSGRIRPFLFGMPYTIWTGICISAGLVIITLIGALVHPGSDKKDKK